MTYCQPNFRSKKALKDAIASGAAVYAFEPGLGAKPRSRTVYLEGPHYPEPHKWYAQAVTDADCKIIKVIK